METIQYPTKTRAVKEHVCNFCSLKIIKRSVYIRSVHKYEGQVYSWKTHEACAEIADKLKMYDNCDEGVSGDDFEESINEEYYTLMSGIIPYSEKYKADFRTFGARLDFVLNHYKIESHAQTN